MKNVLRLTLILSLLLGLLAAFPAAAQEEDGVLLVGTDAAYPPFEFTDENGEIVGFEIDLLNAIAADAGFEVQFVNAIFDTIFTALAEGEFDMVMSAATITEEREEIVDFSDPYFNAGQSIVVRADLAETVATPEDLVGLKVGVQRGTTGAEYASNIEGIEVSEFDDITIAFQALKNGDVDAIINDDPVSADILANNPDIEAVIVGEPLTDEFYGIAVQSGNTELLDSINTSLANIIASGQYAEIYMEWFGKEAPSMFTPEGAMAGDSIADIVVGNEDFSTLLTAIQAANPAVLEALSGEGEFTVFAPNNAAFETLPPGLLETVLASEPSVTAILQYHVIEGKFMAEDVAGLLGQPVPTLLGAPVVFTAEGDKVFINGIEIIATDIEASNGVIHVIGGVLVPERPQ